MKVTIISNEQIKTFNSLTDAVKGFEIQSKQDLKTKTQIEDNATLNLMIQATRLVQELLTEIFELKKENEALKKLSKPF